MDAPLLELTYATKQPFTHGTLGIVRDAKHAVWGQQPVALVPVDTDPDIGFGVSGRVQTLTPAQIARHPAAHEFLVSAFQRFRGVYPTIPAKTLFLDIETHNAGKEFDMPLDEFFRLGQLAWGWDGDIVLTSNLDYVLHQIRQADLIVAHNGHSFDFSVLLGDEALEFARHNRLLDTFVHAGQVFPAPREYRNSAGHLYQNGETPTGTMKWLGLDNLCYQLKIPGKLGDLKAVAKPYQPEGTRVADYDYGLIPLDDPTFLDYAHEDIVALRSLTRELLNARPMTDYDWREQLRTAIDNQMMRNGVVIDVEMARKRVAEIEHEKATLLAELSKKYNFPTDGAMPWRTKAGKAAIMEILSVSGITPQTHPDWPLTATGNLSLGGDALVQITKETPAEHLGSTLAALMGQRPLAQQALDHLKGDGRVHSQVTGFQRSGRRSTTKVGFTTWTSRGDGAREKAYFIAPPGYVMMEFDYSNADQRIVAALSGDREYAKRFDEGVDGHEINGRLMFGDQLYETDPKFYRNAAKAPGHALTYGAGPKKLAATSGLPLETIETFVDNFFRKYPRVNKWQMQVREDGESGWVTNAWGRRMPIGVYEDPVTGERRSKAWTQAPALHGQSGTNEVVTDGLVRMLDHDPRLIQWLTATIHDAILMTFPEDELDYVTDIVPKLMSTTFNGIEFTLAHGKPGRNWYEASH